MFLCITKNITHNLFYYYHFFKLGFTPCKAEQPLQGMKLHEKEAQEDYSIQDISLGKTYS